MKKLLFILIGPKGSGKTYIGSKIEQLTDIKFLPVEPLWLQLAEGESGWAKVENEIDRLFRQHDKVVIESLGAGDGFNGLHASLKEKYDIKLIKVETDLDECLRRVRERDSADHIPVSDEKVREYNRIAAGVEHPWDAVIDNNGPATDEEILRVITSVDCIVCRKHRGEVNVPGGVIYEDDLIFISHAQLWRDEKEHYLGHVFVETKRHVAEVADLTDKEAQAVGLYTSRIARALLHCEGVEHIYIFVIGDGVHHVHYHVIGRYPGAPREYWGPRVDEWPEAPKGNEAQIMQVAERLRAFLKKHYSHI